MEKMYRVAISDWSPHCNFCRVIPGERFAGDYCLYCQYTYNSLAEVREYADATVAWCQTLEEADAIKASLVPYRIFLKAEMNKVTCEVCGAEIKPNEPNFYTLFGQRACCASCMHEVSKKQMAIRIICSKPGAGPNGQP